MNALLKTMKKRIFRTSTLKGTSDEVLANDNLNSNFFVFKFTYRIDLSQPQKA